MTKIMALTLAIVISVFLIWFYWPSPLKHRLDPISYKLPRSWEEQSLSTPTMKYLKGDSEIEVGHLETSKEKYFRKLKSEGVAEYAWKTQPEKLAPVLAYLTRVDGKENLVLFFEVKDTPFFIRIVDDDAEDVGSRLLETIE